MGDVHFSGTAKVVSGALKPKESEKPQEPQDSKELQESKDTPCTHSKCKPPSEQ